MQAIQPQITYNCCLNTLDAIQGFYPHVISGEITFLWGHACKKWQASDLMPLHLSYLPHSGSQPNLNITGEGEEGQEVLRALGLARISEWHQSYCVRFSGEKNVSERKLCMYGVLVNTLEASRLQGITWSSLSNWKKKKEEKKSLLK